MTEIEQNMKIPREPVLATSRPSARKPREREECDVSALGSRQLSRAEGYSWQTRAVAARVDRISREPEGVPRGVRSGLSDPDRVPREDQQGREGPNGLPAQAFAQRMMGHWTSPGVRAGQS